MSSHSKPPGLFDRTMRRIFGAADLQPSHRSLDPRPLLMAYARRAKRYPLALACVLTSTSCERIAYLFGPLILAELIDLLNAWSKQAPDQTAAVHAIILYGTMLMLSWLFSRITTFGLCHMTPLVMADLKKEGMSYTIRHNHRFFASTFLGKIVKTIDRYANNYDSFADKIVFDIVPTLIQFTGVIIVLYGRHPALALLVVTWMSIVIGANFLFAKWKLPYDASQAAEESRTTGVLADSVANNATVASHASYKAEEARYAEVVDRQARWQRFSWMSGTLFEAFQGLSVRLIELGVISVGVYYFFRGDVTMGTIILALTYARVVGDQTWSFSRILRELYKIFADGKEMTDILATPHEIREPKHPAMSVAERGTIEFKDVSFGYQGETTLSHFSLSVRPGERVAIVGPSGAGKSTVIRLALRDYDPISGSVLVDGCDLRNLLSWDRAARMALVPQDPALFHLSLMDNIRYGRPWASDEEVIEAAKLAQADEFIRKTPQGYDTLVGERGVKLSGGQRQRVAIARAFLRDASILLLDEATSSLDSESELHIQVALKELMQNKTTIVVAHRLSTVRSANRIVVLDGGAIGEDGTHDELIEKGGMYARLWSLQKDGFFPGTSAANDAAVDTPLEIDNDDEEKDVRRA